jgi:nucleotide-binding universal stress UspA family protein
METSGMINVVVPVCDQRGSGWQIEQVIELYRQGDARVHLLNVQPPLPRHVSRFFNGGQLRDFHEENGMRALAPVMRSLDAAGVPYKAHVLVGLQAETIVRFAKEYECRRIVMEEGGDNWMSVLGLGSISSQVRHLTRARRLGVSLGGA